LEDWIFCAEQFLVIVFVFFSLVFRSHRYARHKMRPIATQVAWSVCVCPLVTNVSPAKLAVCHVDSRGQRNYVLDGGRSHKGWGTLGDILGMPAVDILSVIHNRISQGDAALLYY